MKKLIKAIQEDCLRAQENHEEYQRMQRFWKQDIEPTAIIDFMTFDYLPDRLRKIVIWKVEMMNRFFNWAWDFRRFSLLTLVMICAIIYIVFK